MFLERYNMSWIYASLSSLDFYCQIKMVRPGQDQESTVFEVGLTDNAPLLVASIWAALANVVSISHTNL